MAFLLEAVINGTLIGCLYALMALGFVLAYKTMRLANFAHGEFVVTGAALAAFAYHVLGMPLGVAIALGMAAMAAFAATASRLIFSRVSTANPIAFVMLTIGLGAFLRPSVAGSLRGFSHELPLPLVDRTVFLAGMLISLDEAMAAGVALAVVGTLGVLFRWSRVGIAFRALADDPKVALAMGINPKVYVPLAWGLVGVLAVIAGVLWSAVRHPGFGFTLVALRVFPIAIIGGLDSLSGAVLGGIIIGLLETLVATYVDPLLNAAVSQVTAFAALAVMQWARPQGLLGSPIVERV